MLHKLWTWVEFTGADRHGSAETGKDPVSQHWVWKCHGISEVYSFLGIIPPLLLDDFQCDTEQAKESVGNSAFLCLKLILLWDIHGHILHHCWILKTGYEQFLPFTCWGPLFQGILERSPSLFLIQVAILRLLFQYNLLLERIDFKAKLNPWGNKICTPRPQELKLWGSKAWPEVFMPCQEARLVRWVAQA